MTIQLGFWGDSPQTQTTPDCTPKEAISKIIWSYYRRSTFEQCLRRYYYEYYGANKQTAKQDQDKAMLHFLKRVQTRHERAGSILHLIIATYLKKRRGGEVWEESRLIKWANDMFQRDIQYSQSHPNGDEAPDSNFPPVLLREFHYHDQHASELCGEIGERLTHAISFFANNKSLEEFRISGSTPEASIEQAINIRLTSTCRIEGRVDLAYNTKNHVTVVDWKLGVEDGTGDDSLQLGVYALWATTERYKCDPNLLRVCKVHFGSSTIVDFKVTQSLLGDTRARILQDAERMLSLQRHGQNSNISAFTPCIYPKVCEGCNFLKVCPEGKECLND
ncbi:MAG: PD-(D/E)XK nuclease family protein [Anaerolineales bacterium]|jgi:hypothetical protein